MTKSNIIGYIGPSRSPKLFAASTQPISKPRKVNPDVEFKIVWAYTWFDPAKEAEAATVLIEQGADVILQHTDSTAPQAAAQAAGNVITFGQASDMAEFAPNAARVLDHRQLGAILHRAHQGCHGRHMGKHTWDGIGAGMVGIGEISDAVPAEVKAEAEAMRDAIAEGSITPLPARSTSRTAPFGLLMARPQTMARLLV